MATRAGGMGSDSAESAGEKRHAPAADESATRGVLA